MILNANTIAIKDIFSFQAIWHNIFRAHYTKHEIDFLKVRTKNKKIALRTCVRVLASPCVCISPIFLTCVKIQLISSLLKLQFHNKTHLKISAHLFRSTSMSQNLSCSKKPNTTMVLKNNIPHLVFVSFRFYHMHHHKVS